eukprot:CAMPEP_0117886322 /NCGR_PEP_ID=MMETSP0950-20121206/20267_1 /TAXON_ID=44440 /ORGANISM="Chattonella subsalsa, Strain CCMP2191" /LENGTH=37 /DNA_ID= /DNA_START= /DNA_END= /DNA_ORIENTATION=
MVAEERLTGSSWERHQEGFSGNPSFGASPSEESELDL